MNEDNEMTFKTYSNYTANKDVTEIEVNDDSIANKDVEKVATGVDTLDLIKKEFNGAIEKLAASSVEGGYESERYPSPYLSLSDMKIPESMTEIFDWCRYFYKFDPVVSGAIEAKATFPITALSLEESKFQRDEGLKSDDKTDVDNEDSEQLKAYKKTFFETLNIYKLLTEIGIDYWAYGNVFIIGEFSKGEDKTKAKWEKMYRIAPNQIIIDRNAATGDVTYKWIVPKHVKKIIKAKKPLEQYNKIPEIVKEAVTKGKSVVFKKETIYHFAKATDSMGDSQWGAPPILNVLKLLMYRNVLRRAQEAIANEHMVPLRVYYFEESKGFNPLGDWKNVMESFKEQLRLNAMDPNRKIVSPIPVNVLNLGGQGKGLLLTAEIEQIQSEILAGLGVPREFIFGGVSWSGSSVSLRILENNFSTYRLLLQDFMQNFIIKGMAIKRKEWVSEADDDKLPTIKMAELKMQDDVQQKQLILQLNSQGKVTNNLVWKTLGLDPDKMALALKEEARAKIETDKELQIEQLDAQLEIQKKQMEVEMELQKYKMELQQKYGIHEVMPEGGGKGQGPQVVHTQPTTEQQAQKEPTKADSKTGAMSKDIKEIILSIIAEKDPAKKAALIESLPENVKNIVAEQMTNMTAGSGYMDAQNSAMQLMKLPADQREKIIASLPKSEQNKILTVIEHLTEELPKAPVKKVELDTKVPMRNANPENVPSPQNPSNKMDMRPLPEQRPPRRQGM